MEGFNGTLFCYGQTGSGKTFSKPEYSFKVHVERALTLLGFVTSHDGSSC
jgi:hypothetical protein